jgi:hypothetical protein
MAGHLTCVRENRSAYNALVLKKRDHWEEPDIDRMIILKHILNI